MAKPFLTFELSADGNSVFVYRGGINPDETDFTGAGEDTRELEACIGLQREDAVYQLTEYARAAAEEIIRGK